MDPLPPPSPTTSYLEIRLFYIRLASPSPSSIPPPRLLLTHHSNSPIQINGVPSSSSSSASVPLRLDRLDRAAGEATYVSTDSVRLLASDFEVATFDDDHPVPLLRGKFEPMDCCPADGWAISCCAAAEAPAGSVFEVYVAGSYKGSPVILTRTVKIGSRRNGRLDAIPEERKGSGKEVNGGLVHQRPRSVSMLHCIILKH